MIKIEFSFFRLLLEKNEISKLINLRERRANKSCWLKIGEDVAKKRTPISFKLIRFIPSRHYKYPGNNLFLVYIYSNKHEQ